jgi:hypothetical protein
MNPDLHQLQHELARSLQGLNSAQTQLRSSSRPDCWSIQQIVEHLLLTYKSTEDALNARLFKGTPTRAKVSLVQRVKQYAVMRLGYFPTGRKAPPPVTPPSLTVHPLSGEALTHAVDKHLASLDTVCHEAEKFFGSTARFATHAVLGPLHVYHWRKFQLIHGRHHIKQILAIRQSHHLQPVSL